MTVDGLPVITAPTTATVGQNQATAISGVSLAESGNTSGETFTVTSSDAHGDAVGEPAGRRVTGDDGPA